MRVGLDQVGAKLIAEPVVALAIAPEGLDVEIGAGQEAAGADAGVHGRISRIVVVVCKVRLDRDSQLAPFVVELQARTNIERWALSAGVPVRRSDGPRATLAGTPIDFQRVGAQHGVRGIVLSAETVVDKEVEDVLAWTREHAREPLYRLTLRIGRHGGANRVGRGELA